LYSKHKEKPQKHFKWEIDMRSLIKKEPLAHTAWVGMMDTVASCLLVSEKSSPTTK
jgi:hypothetical protein